MSFAIGMFDKGGNDILLGVDRRWVEGEVGNFQTLTDVATKSIRLNSHSGLAFTGKAELVAKIVIKLYNNESLACIEPINVLDEIERKKMLKKGATIDFEAQLNEIVPTVRKEYDDRYDLCVMLVGKINKQAMIIQWTKNGNWSSKRTEYDTGIPYVAILPLEAPCGTPQYDRTHEILLSPGLREDRIRRAIGFLANHSDVQSVSNSCLIRRRSSHFKKKELETITPHSLPTLDQT